MEQKSDIPAPLKVLCLEDSPQDAEIISELLIDAGYQVKMDCSANENEYISFLKNNRYDIILSDFKLPGFNAFSALQLAIKICPSVPFICVSGSIGEETAIELLKQGAIDYVLKDRMGRLGFAVKRALKDAEEKESLKRIERQREAALEALYESEHRYHTLTDSSPVGIFHTRADGYTTYVNSKWCEISGLDSEKALGNGWLDAVHPDDRESLIRGWEESTSLLRASFAEYRFLRPDNSIAWVLGQAVPERDPDGKIVGYVGTITDITQRKKAEIEKARIENELRLNEERLNYALEATSDAIYDRNYITKEFYLSPRYYAIFGFKPSEFPDSFDGWKDLVHPDDINLVNTVFQYSNESISDTYEFEYRMRTKSGEWKWILNCFKVVEREKSGAIIRLIGAISDITQRKVSEIALRRSNRALKILSICNGIIVKSKNESALLKNVCKTIVETGGYRMAWVGFCEKNNEKTITPAAWAGFEENFFKSVSFSWGMNNWGASPAGESIRTGKPVVLSDIRKDQNYIPWLESSLDRNFQSAISLPLIYGDNTIGSLNLYSSEVGEPDNEELKLLSELAGDIAYGIKSIRTSIEHKNAEKKARESENKYRTLVETSSDVIFTLDMDGRFEYISPNIEKISGYRFKDLLGHTFDEIVSVKFVDMTMEKIRETLPAGKNVLVEIEFTDINKNKIPAELNLVRLINDKNQPMGTLGIARDISERKKLENQLLQSQKIEAIGNLAGGIAHDFNNILTVILGNTEICKRNLENKVKLESGLEQINKSARRAASLTYQLLAFSRRQMVQPKILDLNEIISDMQNMLQRLIGEDIDLAIIQSPSLMNILADQGQMSQVVMNLIVNAKDAMPNGGTITVKTSNETFGDEILRNYPEAKAGKFVCLTVSDNGTGISDEIIENIFEPFFTTKGEGRGTRLGLSVVYGIIKQNKGWINVESKVGKGTTFKIFLPGIPAQDNSKKETESTPEFFIGNGEKILVLEDDDALRDLAKLILNNSGYEVLESMSINDAFAILKKENGKFDLVFSDIILPDGSGIDFFEEARSLYPNLKVLFTSGYADEKSKWQVIQKMNYEFIQKPYEKENLLKAIKNTLKL